MATFIDRVIADRRTLRQALTDIRAKYEDRGDPDLAEMIRHAEAEIIERESKSPAELRTAWPNFSDKALVERRSLEQVLSDLRDKYQRRAGPELAGRIRNVEAEISLREVAHKATGGTETTEPTAV